MRYPPFKKARLKKERRTIPLKANDLGSGRSEIDAGRYFRCWNCGFICNIDRNALSDGRNGSVPENYAVAPTGIPYADTLSSEITGHGLEMVLPQADAAGDAVVVQEALMAGGTGCPLCFSRAWR